MIIRSAKNLTPKRLSAVGGSKSCRPRCHRFYSSEPPGQPKRSVIPPWIRPYIAVGGLAAVASLAYLYGKDIQKGEALSSPKPAEIRVEEKRTSQKRSREENRESLSSQHVQVKRSWEHPGVYAWGSNSGRVANPDSGETFIKQPRRIAYFDGMLLRDLKLDRNFGAAIDEKGNLIQWGKGYSETAYKPTVTLKGKDLVSLSLSRDRIVALSSGGDLYSLPAAKNDQEGGQKLYESSWMPFWKSKAQLSYRRLRPNLGFGEKVTAISGGLEHLLMLTSSGRVFSAACSSEHFPSRGQLGVPGLTWTTRPPGPYDTCHEVGNLRGFQMVKTAAGDYHSLVLDRDGRVFSFGDNTSGQLGLPTTSSSDFTDTPLLLPLQNLYRGKTHQVGATGIAAGGSNSFFTVDAKRILSPSEDKSTVANLGRITTDVWSCGKGLYGGLGNGRFTHIQDTPTKVKALSGLFEFDEDLQKVVPIGVRNLSVGSTHASAVLGNFTNVTASNSSQADTNWGSDLLFWGGNEFF